MPGPPPYPGCSAPGKGDGLCPGSVRLTHLPGPPPYPGCSASGKGDGLCPGLFR